MVQDPEGGYYDGLSGARLAWRLGPHTHPALHYPLGDGTDADAWATLQKLTAHLKAGEGMPSRSG